MASARTWSYLLVSKLAFLAAVISSTLQQLRTEPGYYNASQKVGVRIESLYLVQKVSDECDFLQFTPLTLVPIQTKLLMVERMTNEEVLWLLLLLDWSHRLVLQISWLNTYHKDVLAFAGPALAKQSGAVAYRWLQLECQPIIVH